MYVSYTLAHLEEDFLNPSVRLPIVRPTDLTKKLISLSWVYGAALMQINIRDLRKLKMAFPRLDDQVGIVKKLDDIAVEVKRLKAIYQHKLTALAELKKSLLQEAFSGELTTERAETAVEEARHERQWPGTHHHLPGGRPGG